MQIFLGGIIDGYVTSCERIPSELREQSEVLVLFLKGNYFML